MRKIVQIAVGITNDEDTFVALCNDGTVWFSRNPVDDWRKLKPIPQEDKQQKS